GVVRLEDGTTLVIDADTALAAEVTAGTSQELEDTGIPFAFVDTEVRNGFTYFYRVTAFDINSLKSGPSSLESASPAKSTIPRAAASNQVIATFQSKMMGDDGVALDPRAPVPPINSSTGTFAGPMPPTNGLEAMFQPLVERLLPAFSLTARIDSITPGFPVDGDCPNGFSALGSCWHYFVT